MITVAVLVADSGVESPVRSITGADLGADSKSGGAVIEDITSDLKTGIQE